MSVMLISMLGTVSGAWLLNKQLHWQDFVAMLLMLAAIGSVPLPRWRRPRPAVGRPGL